MAADLQPFDQTGAQIFSNSIDSGRHFRPIRHHLKLITEFGMAGPLARHVEYFTGHGCHQDSHHRHEIPPTAHFYLRNSETVFVLRNLSTHEHINYCYTQSGSRTSASGTEPGM